MKNENITFKTKLYNGIQILIRPFIDFYFNYGLTRASVLSYVLCANLVIFVYLFMTIGVTISIAPLASIAETQRFLELHFLWPSPERILLENAPDGFGMIEGSLVTQSSFDKHLEKYCQKRNINDETLQNLKNTKKLNYRKFSITEKLGRSIYNATRDFYEEKNEENITPLGVRFFFVLALAYWALLLSIKTNLAESVSPLVWGNLPLSHRRSEIKKLLWRIPPMDVVRARISIIVMLPILATLVITLMSSANKIVDALVDRYSTLNILLSTISSLFFTTISFMGLYMMNVSGISRKNAAWGAFIAASLWLGGRWYFTTYSAVSLYRTLRNFALIPIFLTWFYYFCTVFLVGIYIAHTLENPNLTYTSRCWGMRDLSCMNRYGILSQWIRLDFLYRLAVSHYEEVRPPFIGIKNDNDTAMEIATESHVHPVFIRECILTMILHHPNSFIITEKGNRQFCTLKIPPEEIDVLTLVQDEQDKAGMLSEMEDYAFVHFLQEKHKFWNAPTLLLSEVYKEYSNICKEFSVSETHNEIYTR